MFQREVLWQKTDHPTDAYAARLWATVVALAPSVQSILHILEDDTKIRREAMTQYPHDASYIAECDIFIARHQETAKRINEINEYLHAKEVEMGKRKYRRFRDIKILEGGSDMQPEIPGATWMPNSNAFPGRNGYTPRWIILHGTASNGMTSAVNIANYFRSTEGTNNPVSAHFVIGQDGSIVQCNAITDGAWANGPLSPGHDDWWTPLINPNNVTISIEHVKPHNDNGDELTPEQKASSFAVVAFLCQHWNIPARSADVNGGITGHYSLDPVNRSRCPGAYPWDELWAFLNDGGNTLTIPQGWNDGGKTLVAPNDHQVVLGFRNYILNNNWDANNVPLEEESHADRVEDYYDQGANNAGSRQLFNYCELAWTPQRGVYVVGIGNELLGCRAERDLLDSEIDQLKAQIAALQAIIDGNPVNAIVKTYREALNKLLDCVV